MNNLLLGSNDSFSIAVPSRRGPRRIASVSLGGGQRKRVRAGAGAPGRGKFVKTWEVDGENLKLVETQGVNFEGKLLAVGDVECTEDERTFSWLAVRDEGRRSGGIVLYRFEAGGLVRWGEVKVKLGIDACVESVVLLRGPVLACTAAGGPGVVVRPGGAQSGLDDSSVAAGAPVNVCGPLCTWESDMSALAVAVWAPLGGDETRLGLVSVDVFGAMNLVCILPAEHISGPESIAAAHESSAAFLAESDGTVIAIKTTTGAALWRTRSENGPLSSLCVAQRFIFWTKQSDKSAVMFLSFGERCLGICAVTVGGDTPFRDAQVLKHADFAESSTNSTSNVDLFAAISHEQMRLCQCDDGTIVATADLTAGEVSASPRKRSDSANDSHLLQVQRNLEMRLRTGLQSLLDAQLRVEQKRQLAKHCKALLHQILNDGPPVARPLFRDTPLRNIAHVQEKLESITVNLHVESNGDCHDGQRGAEVNETSDGLDANWRRVLSRIGTDDKLVRVIRSEHGFILSGQLLNITVDAVALDDLDMSISKMDSADAPAASLRLDVRMERCIPMTWQVECLTNVRPGDVLSLSAQSPIDAIVAGPFGGLSHLRVALRVVSSDGRQQHLGSFLVSPMARVQALRGAPYLSSRGGVNAMISREKERSFNDIVRAIAVGPDAGRLRKQQGTLANGALLRVRARESVAELYFAAPTSLSLAAGIANVKASAADGVQLRPSALSSKSLEIVDQAIKGLHAESAFVRNAATRDDSTGYDSECIEELLRLQVSLDEAVGALEEQVIGV